MVHVSPDELLEVMHELKLGSIPFVVATVIGARGSTPRKTGAKMIVTADGRTFGTVGGGAVESKIIERARLLLVTPALERFSWELASGDAGNMVCGGSMEFLLEPFLTRPRAYVFGAGHVGQALSRLLVDLSFDVTVVDDRETLLSLERLPGVRLHHAHPKDAAVELPIPADAFAVIVTRAHSQDLEALRGLVQRDLRYLGMRASRKKRTEVLATLHAEGVAEARLAAVRSPVGLDIGAETPAEIAVAIAAEMVTVLRREPG
jgi:xanthine dehydrogenase accessory factor